MASLQDVYADSFTNPFEDTQLIIPEILATQQHDTDQLNKDFIVQELARKQFPLEDSELIFKGFERLDDNDHFEKSYLNSQQLSEVVHGAMSPTVSIVFMAGADMMSVNQDEQKNMTSTTPSQRTPRWRVLTAGALLCNYEIDDNLTWRGRDNTAEIVSKIKGRRPPEAPESSFSRALSLRSQPKEDRILTIDSDNVTIVNALIPGTTDLEVTLIEVDKSSIFSLLIDFHQFVRNGSASMIFDNESRLKLLEVMVENAHRLAVRSPILFRMSTRRKIACSKNTRYGVAHETMFETVTTSVGIKNIIYKAAACFNSLANPGEQNNHEQSLIRPKFLQMLTLLLSLLNDDDLADIGPLLESTYRIKADRPSIELLVLKVLPLRSINKKIFTTEMYLAVQPQSHSLNAAFLPDDEEDIWNRFITKLIHMNYLLPGYTDQMGQLGKSYIVKYPEGEGFKDSYVFNNLQYADEHATINTISYIDLGMSKRTGAVTSMMANKKRYTMSVADHSKITAMMFGTYPLTDVAGPRRIHNLFITEKIANEPLNQAIYKTNHIIDIINRFFSGPKIRRKLSKSMSSALDVLSIQPSRERAATMHDIVSCGRLSVHEAFLGDQNNLIAVSYKVEGKKIAREDLVRSMATDAGKVRTALRHIVLEISRYESRKIDEHTRTTIIEIKKRMPEIESLLAQAERHRTSLQNAYLNTSNEPIEQTIHSTSNAVQGNLHWSQYDQRLENRQLKIAAHRYQVDSVTWISDEIIDVFFRDERRKFTLSPLRAVRPGEQHWEIRPDDKVLMVGQYIVIVVPEDEDEVELAAPQPEHVAQHYHPAMRSISDSAAYNSPAARFTATRAQRVCSDGSVRYEDKEFADSISNFTSQVTPPRQMPANEHYVAYNDRYARAREARPEVFANWIKIIAVEEGITDPRKRNRKRFTSWSESTFN